METIKKKTTKKIYTKTEREFDEKCECVLNLLQEIGISGYIFLTSEKYYKSSWTSPFDEKQWLQFIGSTERDTGKYIKQTIEGKK